MSSSSHWKQLPAKDLHHKNDRELFVIFNPQCPTSPGAAYDYGAAGTRNTNCRSEKESISSALMLE